MFLSFQVRGRLTDESIQKHTNKSEYLNAHVFFVPHIIFICVRE
jgi:hypothetical protein